MPIYNFVCDSCSEEADEILPFDHQPLTCPKCGVNMRQRFTSFSFRGIGFKWQDDGKHDKTVFYQDGHSKQRRYNELYRDGVIGATR